MKFKDLTINQTFTMTEYPNCLAIKVKRFGGSCCSPPHNAKIICEVDNATQEKHVLIDDNTDVELQVGASIQPQVKVIAPQNEIQKSKVKQEKPLRLETKPTQELQKLKKTEGGGTFGP